MVRPPPHPTSRIVAFAATSMPASPQRVSARWLRFIPIRMSRPGSHRGLRTWATTTSTRAIVNSALAEPPTTPGGNMRSGARQRSSGVGDVDQLRREGGPRVAAEARQELVLRVLPVRESARDALSAARRERGLLRASAGMAAQLHKPVTAQWLERAIERRAFEHLLVGELAQGDGALVSFECAQNGELRGGESGLAQPVVVEAVADDAPVDYVPEAPGTGALSVAMSTAQRHCPSASFLHTE